MYRIGIDLGGTNIAAGLVDENYHIVRKGSVPTNANGRSGEEIVDDMAALCARICEEEGIKLSDIAAIGI
ncbi:MAG: ROK family protein, partial [Clostridia bacterium]|nr:ROK family protein [Clostridia bacterium]